MAAAPCCIRRQFDEICCLIASMPEAIAPPNRASRAFEASHCFDVLGEWQKIEGGECRKA
jgi:hypothetical protein